MQRAAISSMCVCGATVVGGWGNRTFCSRNTRALGVPPCHVYIRLDRQKDQRDVKYGTRKIHGKTTNDEEILRETHKDAKGQRLVFKPPGAKMNSSARMFETRRARGHLAAVRQGRGCRQSFLLCTYVQKRNTVFPLLLHLLPVHPHHLHPSPMRPEET